MTNRSVKCVDGTKVIAKCKLGFSHNSKRLRVRTVKFQRYCKVADGSIEIFQPQACLSPQVVGKLQLWIGLNKFCEICLGASIILCSQLFSNSLCLVLRRL